MRWTASAAAAMILGLAGCAGLPASQEPAAIVGPTATVTRDGDRWSAEFELDRDAPVWAFRRSALTMEGRTPWRPGQWTVETPGVVMERQGNLDVLRSADGGPLPRRLRFSLKPASANLEADYDPSLVFTDGSVALYAGHFDLFPLESVEAARALPLDLDEAGLETRPTRVTWRDRAGPVLFQGERRPEAVSTEGGAYVLFGQAATTDTPELATVTDPQLPEWVGREIGAFGPRVAGYYKSRLGPGQTEKPTILISWRGPTRGLISMGGSVLDGMIVMVFEGEGVLESSPEALDTAQWFIGHESAHFWLGHVVRYEFARDAWITEGGADLMAVRAMSRIDPAHDARARLQSEVDDCVALADDPVATANQRGEHRAYYACGAVFAMAAEGFQTRRTGGDWFDFLKPLIDANREDGVLTREEWLTALTAVAGDAAARRDVETLLDRGSPEAATVVARLFDRSGVAYRLEAGKIVLG